MRSGLNALVVLVSLGATGTTACVDSRVILGDWPGIVRIVAGLPDQAGNDLGSDARTSLLSRPRGLVLNDDGTLYIADSGSGRILAVTSSGGIELVAGPETPCGNAPCLGRPEGLALDLMGRLVIADPQSSRIWRIDPATATSTLEPLAGTGEAAAAADAAVAVASPLWVPTGVAVDRSGVIYFSERAAHVIWKIVDGRLVRVAGTGVGGLYGDGLDARSARLQGPAGLAVGDNVLFVADASNHVVRAVDRSTGVIERVAGSGQEGFAGDGRAAESALLRHPEDVAVTLDGKTLFVADASNHRIRMVNLAAGTIDTFVGTGETAFQDDGLDAGSTSLFRPGGVAIGASKLLFLADTNHHLVRRTPVRF